MLALLQLFRREEEAEALEVGAGDRLPTGVPTSTWEDTHVAGLLGPHLDCLPRASLPLGVVGFATHSYGHKIFFPSEAPPFS